MKLFHGSTTLFERPTDSRFKEGFSNSEYGMGFNTSDYGGDAWEYSGAMNGIPGIIYEYEFDESRLANWLVHTRPIGDAVYQRIMDNLHRLPADRAKTIRDDLRPDTDGYDAFGILQGRSAKGCRFMVECGIEGAQTGNYYVFFSSRFVPAQTIKQVVGDFPAAEEAFERQKATGKLTVDQAVKADGTTVGPRKSYMSEELGTAAHYIHRTNDKRITERFERMAAILLSEEWTKPGGYGFDIRNNMGLAFQRLLNDGGLDLADHWSGANTMTRNVEWIKQNVNGADEIIAHAQEIAAAITAHAERTRAPAANPA